MPKAWHQQQDVLGNKNAVETPVGSEVNLVQCKCNETHRQISWLCIEIDSRDSM